MCQPAFRRAELFSCPDLNRGLHACFVEAIRRCGWKRLRVQGSSSQVPVSSLALHGGASHMIGRAQAFTRSFKAIKRLYKRLSFTARPRSDLIGHICSSSLDGSCLAARTGQRVAKLGGPRLIANHAGIPLHKPWAENGRRLWFPINLGKRMGHLRENGLGHSPPA